MSVSIILPTYNEKEALPILLKDLRKIQPDAELIIVDDNSPDGTGKLAEQLKQTYNLNIIHRPKRLGLSTAVVQGFKVATGDIIGVMDADLSHPVDAIPRLLAPILDKKADLAIGSRLIKGGGVEDWPIHRKMVSWGATMLARPMTDVRDPLSGFFFLKKEIVQKMNIKSVGYKVLMEILVKGKYSAQEIPYVFRNRKKGSSKLGARQYFGYLSDISRLYWHKISNHI